MVLIGIDPGASGGIAVKTPDGKVQAIKMPDTDTGILNSLKSFRDENHTNIVLMELVTGFIGKRKKVIYIQCPKCGHPVPFEKEEADPASRSFKFGQCYGKLEMACLALGFRFEKPMIPKSWQKIHGLYKQKGITQTAWKNILKDRAQKLYPDLKVTLATADAILILDVLIRMQNNYNKF